MSSQTPKSIQRIIRVNHAGEYGAKRIYQAQIDVLGHTEIGDDLRHMYDQEKVHLDTFDKMITERQIRPTVLSPLWHMGAYAMGYVTGKMGPEAAMACTEAVEEVIEEHYENQVRHLKENMPEEQALCDTIEQFCAEEIEHRDLARQRDAHKSPAYPILKETIKSITKMAIFFSKKL